MSFTSSLNYTQTLIQEASGSLTIQGSGSTGRTDILTINGNNGTLFSVSDDLSNSLFSVNTIAGLPVIEAFANNTVVMGQYGQNVLVVTGSRVGIGTSTPGAKLDVNGTSLFQNELSIYYTNAIQTMHGTSGASLLRMYGNSSGVEMQVDAHSSNSGAATIGTFSNSNLYIKTNNTNRVIITSGGDVGIGTSSPATKLDVNGGIKATTIQLTSGASDGYVLTSDSSGNGSWQAPASGGGGGGLHILTTPISGWLYTNLITNNFTSPIQTTAFDFVDFSLFLPANNIRATELSLYVSTAAATTTNVKIVVFTDEDYGYPRTKIIESTSMSANTTGLKTFVTTYTFEAGKKYWLGYKVDTDDTTLRLTGISGNALYTRNGNAFITQNGMYFSAPYNSIPTTNTNALTKTNLNAAQILLTSA
jgi:hypothetical protein